MFNAPVFVYLATVLPPVLLGAIIWKSDRFPEPGKFLIASFLLGVSIFLPLDFLILVTENHIGPLLGLDIEQYNEWRSGGWKEEGAIDPTRGVFAFMNFFRAAFLEEGLKFALLIFFCVRLSNLNEPMDAIVYGAAIGLGYAAMENIPYLYSEDPNQNWTMEAVRGRYYPLVMHMGFGVVMGWLLSQNLFEERSLFKRRLMLILSLAIPVIFHGSYNYLRAGDIFPVLTLILTFGVIYFYRRDQLKKITENEDKANVDNVDVFYAYATTSLLVILVVASAMMY